MEKIRLTPKKPKTKELSNISDMLSYEEWRSLIEALKESPNFVTRVKSSPMDTLRAVYALATDTIDNFEKIEGYENKFVVVLTEDKVNVEVVSYKDKFINSFIQCLFEDPIKNMPLYINDHSDVIRIVAKWRLRRGI